MIFQTGGYFTGIYLLGMFIIYLVFPKDSWQRFFGGSSSEYTKNKNKIIDKISSYTILISWWGIIIYSVFVPVVYNTIYFKIGLILFIISMILYETALFNYASTPVGESVKGGLYRISRNPQYVFDFFIWIGVGLMCSSYLIIIVKIIGSIVQHFTVIEEEYYCLEKYGKDYEKYLNETPRYFLFI